MRSISIILSLGWILFILFACNTLTHAAQDSDEQVSTVTLTIVPACRLEIADNNVSETIIADSTAETSFDSGFVEFPADKPTLIVNSNKEWKLAVKASNLTGPYQKDISDLMLKDSSSLHVKNGFDEYKPLSINDQDMAMHTEGVKNENHPCQYKILIDWNKDIPGTYQATVTYTLSTTGS